MAGVGGGGQVGRHWSSIGLGAGGLCPFLVASAEFYYCAPEDKEIKPGVLSGGKKIFLCWNFQNLLSSYIARDISDCQEGGKPVGVSPICRQRGRNIICLNTSSSESLIAGGLSSLSL